MKLKYHRFFTILGALIMFFLILLLIFDTKGIMTAVYSSVFICLEVIIPSLFAFMVLSSLILSTNLYKIIFKPLIIIFKLILKITEHESGIFILSLIGGYPVGAKLIQQAVKNGTITQKSAQKMINYCFASGPSFITGIVGVGVFGNVKTGLILYFSNIIASLILAFILNINHKQCNSKSAYNISFTADKLIYSITSSAQVLFEICAMIVGFSVINRVISYLPFELLGNALNVDKEFLQALIFSISEISNIRSFSANVVFLPLISALLSFGGICVLMQVKSILGQNIRVRNFVIIRAFGAIISGAVTFVYIKIANPVLTVSNHRIDFFTLTEARNIVPSLCLVFMTIILFKSLLPKPD